MSKTSRSSRRLMLVAALITLALTAGIILGVNCTSEGADSPADTGADSPADTGADSPVIARNWAGSPEQIIANVTPQEASMILMNAIIEAEGVAIVGGATDFHVIDIRSYNECEGAGVISTMQVPVDFAFYKSPGQFKVRVDYLHKDRTYLLYGATGEYTEKALAVMEELGFREVYNMLGGFEAWSAEGLPTAILGECGVGNNG